MMQMKRNLNVDMIFKQNERNLTPTNHEMLICVISDINGVFSVSFLFPLTSDHMGKIHK